VTALFGGKPGMVSGAAGSIVVVLMSLAAQHGMSFWVTNSRESLMIWKSGQQNSKGTQKLRFPSRLYLWRQKAAESAYLNAE